MKNIPVLTYYLEMEEKPIIEIGPAPFEGVSFERAKDLSVDDYIEIYRAVGDPYGWFDRVLMKKEDLKKIIEDHRRWPNLGPRSEGR